MYVYARTPCAPAPALIAKPRCYCAGVVRRKEALWGRRSLRPFRPAPKGASLIISHFRRDMGVHFPRGIRSCRFRPCSRPAAAPRFCRFCALFVYANKRPRAFLILVLLCAGYLPAFQALQAATKLRAQTRPQKAPALRPAQTDSLQAARTDPLPHDLPAPIRPHTCTLARTRARDIVL